MPAIAESPALPAKLVGKPDVAKLFGIQLQTVSLWAKNGKLPPPIRIGRRMFWRPETLAPIIGLGDLADVGGSPLRAAEASASSAKEGAKSC